jgi:eukaryotic-like serine/threonine-protein kinase
VENSLTCPKCLKPLDASPNYCPACGEDLRGLTPLSDTLSGVWSGQVIDGRYRLREKLGEGGMGAVYKVEHVRMGKVLAIKLLRPDLAIDKKLKNRFQQEARLVSKLSHPNTIQVFDFGELEDGALYIAMEYLPGRDLSWTLRAQGPLSEDRLSAIGAQVLSSLAEAHDQGIVHRDIKPANVMLVKRRDRGDLVKVLDFGIAQLNEGEGRKRITGAADFVGTPTYMSPEQAKGEPLDDRSDLYSTAAMMFELATGRPVFEAKTPMAMITRHLEDDPPRLAEAAPNKTFTPAFEQVLRKALAKDRKDRWASAEEMREALEGARRELRPSLHDYTPLPEESAEMARREDFDQFERALRIRRASAPVLALALVVGVAAGGWRWLNRQPAVTVVTAEIEGNDDYDHANPIALDRPVTGKIGAPLSERESDRDLYVLEVPAAGLLSVELSGVPDMNLVMQLTELQLEKRQLFVDDVPTGAGERVEAFWAEAGKLYVRVEERHHYTESPRPPRESSRAEYTLTVRPTPGAGQVEREPNDTVELSTRVEPGKTATGYPGAALPYDTRTCEQVLSTADFLAVRADVPKGEGVSALVVPPAAGKLAVVDGGEFEVWRRKFASVDARPALPPARVLAGKPDVVALTASSQGWVVRIQAVGLESPPGAPYHVAFLTGEPGGLDAALALGRELLAAGRARDAEAALRLAEKAFPRSPQLPELRALLADPAVAEAAAGR